MIRLSPEFKAKLHKFKANKRAWYSLIILTAIFFFTLPAELLFNDRPIVMKVDGGFFFPIFKDYTYRDLGGDWDVPVVSYESETFKNFIDGKVPVVNPEAMLFVDGVEGEFITYEEGEKHTLWALNPPFRHSYLSFYNSDKLERQRLANPFETTHGDVTVPGASVEGHYLGTDKYGKDVLARLIYGFRLSLLFGLALACTSTIVGCILGAIQGYFGGLVDLSGQRMTEVWAAIPRLMLLMLLSDFLSRKGELSEFQHVFMLFLILNLTSWMGMAAHMRAMFLRARNLDYVKAAKALGVSNQSIMCAAHIAARFGDFTLWDSHVTSYISYGARCPVCCGSSWSYACAWPVSNPIV